MACYLVNCMPSSVLGDRLTSSNSDDEIYKPPPPPSPSTYPLPPSPVPPRSPPPIPPPPIFPVPPLSQYYTRQPALAHGQRSSSNAPQVFIFLCAGMSSENHGHSSSELLELLGRDVHEIHKQPRFSYTRGFLLSLSELDICKKLPVGFDASLLSEFEDTSSNSLQLSRSQGGFYSQSSRRNEYGYTQTNRSETSSNYSRGSQGKWETRSSGSSDREELLTRDSSAQDTGKHNLNQPRRVWKQTEQDGLLGKPSGYSGQASSQRPRGNGLYTLNKSTEPYQPPRPYKAVSHSWRDNSDSINDETFGLSDCSEDRAEEERKRRASFELMRKEQQKVLQEKQIRTTDNLKEDLDAPLIASLKNPEGLLASRNKNDADVNAAQLQSDSSKIVQTQLSSSRPRVPPGFRSASSMKNVSALPSEMTFASQAKKSASHIPPVLSKDTFVKSEVDSILETEGDVPSTTHTADSITVILSNAMEKSSPVSRNSDPPSYQAFGPVQATEGWMDTPVHSNFSNSQDTRTVVNVPSSQDHSKSLLDELFKNVDKQNDGDLSNFVEAAMHENEGWNSTPFLTSRFSDWFPEEQRQPEEKYPSKDLFSQLFSNEKAKNEESLVINEIAVENIDAISSTIIPDEKDIEDISSFFPFVSGTISNIVQATEDCYTAVTPDASLSVLTCEDLEQSILAEANATIAAKSSPLSWDALGVKSESSTDANDHASQHLRLLLHVGSEAQNLTSEIFNSFGSTATKNACTNDIFDTSEIGEHSSKGHSVQIPLVFEGLFPADVMKGLQSTEGPLSKQMGSADGIFKTIASQSHELPLSYPVHSIDDHLSPLNQECDYVSANEVSEFSRNPALSTHKVQEPWNGFKASNLDGISANGTFDINAAFKEIRLPEEKNFVGPGENLSSLIPDPFSDRNFSQRDEQLRLKSPDNIVEKLANLNPVFRNQRGSQLPGTEGSLPNYGSFELVESDPQYRQFPGRHAPFVHQSSQTGPLFQQHDPREFRNLHREFMAPDSVPYGPPCQFHHNVVHPQSFHTPGLQVDPSGQFKMLANIPVPGNFSSQELHGFPRGGLPSHPMNHLPQMQEMDTMHNFPMPHGQTSHDLGMEMSGIGIGNSSYANTLGRFFEMDARAARQTHPLAGSHLHGSYSTEVDLGFRYR